MPESSTTLGVRQSAAHMFDFVPDVERYPEFVPLCRSLKVRQRIPEPEGVEVLVADMTVAYKFVRETFTTRITLDRPNLHILVEYLQGPFSRLENRWIFHPTGEQTCEVEFFISYEFKSRTLSLLMGAMFDAAFRRFTAAFERRADVGYARGDPSHRARGRSFSGVCGPTRYPDEVGGLDCSASSPNIASASNRPTRPTSARPLAPH